MRMRSTVRFCALRSTVSLCALAVPMIRSSAVSLCACALHVTKIIYALLFQVVLYHALSERQLLASPLHQNRYSAVFISVVRNSVADPECLSRITDLNTVFPSRIQNQKDPGSGSASKNLSNFNPKTCF
jgi:hypothetical protein